jgi:hypothetical protein
VARADGKVGPTSVQHNKEVRKPEGGGRREEAEHARGVREAGGVIKKKQESFSGLALVSNCNFGVLTSDENKTSGGAYRFIFVQYRGARNTAWLFCTHPAFYKPLSYG